jgi:sugar lactone lactonase YvrE
LGGLWRITPDGTASRIIAGDELALPAKITVDANGNLFLAESAANRILQIRPAGDWQPVAGAGEVGYVDGDSAQALFSLPLDVAVDDAGVLYVADSGNGRIRKITPDGQVSTVAGGERGFADGPGSEARFNGIAGLTLDAAGTLYVAEANGERVRLIAPDGTVSTLAGSGEIGFKDGAAAQAEFNGSVDVALDQAGNVYVVDLGNHSVRLITPDGQVTTIAGTGESGYVDGSGDNAQFWFPQAIVVNKNGVIYVADSGNGLIRIIRKIENE